MLVIKIELWPFGDEERKVSIATSKIWNEGTGTSLSPTDHAYGFEFKDLSDFTPEAHFEPTAPIKGGICDHDRRRNVWELVMRCTKEAVKIRDEKDK